MVVDAIFHPCVSNSLSFSQLQSKKKVVELLHICMDWAASPTSIGVTQRSEVKPFL
jgi:hypothetical protein